MPQSGWSDKRERQYQDIKASEKARGVKEKRAEQIAARTVNKTRARLGETEQQHGQTKEQLYDEAKRRGVKGRSMMTKAELEKALRQK
ncbi:hypothetical protein GCM10027589_44200 [Actinocorallia lasiicapitis]